MVRYFANVENLETPDTKITDSGYFVPSATPETFRLENYFTKIKREIKEYKDLYERDQRFAFPQSLWTVPERAIYSTWFIDWSKLDRDIFKRFKDSYNSEAAIKFRYADLPAVRDSYKTLYSWKRVSHDLHEFLWWKKETRDLFEKYWTSGQADNWVSDHREILSLPFEFFIDLSWFATGLTRVLNNSTKVTLAKKALPIAKAINKTDDPYRIYNLLINKTSGAYPDINLCRGLARNSYMRHLDDFKVARTLIDFNQYPLDTPLSKIYHRAFRPKGKTIVPGLFETAETIKQELPHIDRWYQDKILKIDSLVPILTGSPESKAKKLERVYSVLRNRDWPTLQHYVADAASGKTPFILSEDEFKLAGEMRKIWDEGFLIWQDIRPRVAERLPWAQQSAKQIQKITGKIVKTKLEKGQITIEGLEKIPEAKRLMKLYGDIFRGDSDIAKIANNSLRSLLSPRRLRNIENKVTRREMNLWLQKIAPFEPRIWFAEKWKRWDLVSSMDRRLLVLKKFQNKRLLYRHIDELLRTSSSSTPFRRNYVKGVESVRWGVPLYKPSRIENGLANWEKAKTILPTEIEPPKMAETLSKVFQNVRNGYVKTVIKRKADLLNPLINERERLTKLMPTATAIHRETIKSTISYLNKEIDLMGKIRPDDLTKMNLRPRRTFDFLSKIFKPSNWSKWQKQMQILYNPGAWINNALDSRITKNAIKNENWTDFLLHPEKYPEWGLTGKKLDFSKSQLARKFIGAESRMAKLAGLGLEIPENAARFDNGRVAYWLKGYELKKLGIFSLDEIDKLAFKFAEDANRFTHFNYGDLTLFDMAMTKIPIFPYWFWGSRNAKFYGAQFVKRPTLFLKLNQLRNWYNQHTSVDGKGGSVLNVPGLGDVKINSLDYLSFNRFIKAAEKLTMDEYFKPSESLAEGQGFNMLYSAIGPPAEWIRMLSTGIVPDQTWRYISPWTRVLRAGTGISIEDYMNDLMGKNATLNREDWERKRSESIQAQYEWEYKQKIPFSQAINQMRKQERILSVMGLFGVYAKPYQTWDKLIETDRSLFFELKDPTQKTLWLKNHPWIFPHSTPGPRDLELDIKLEGYEKKKPEEIKSELPKEPVDVIKYVSNFMTDKIAPAVFETVFPAEKVEAAETKLTLPEERADFPNELQSIKPEYRKDGKYQMYGFKKGEEWKEAPVLRPVFPNLSLQRNKANSDRMKVLGFLNTEISKTDTLEEAQEILKKYPKQVASYKEVRSVVPVYGNIQNVIQNEETIRHVKYKKHAGNTILGEIKDTLDAKNKKKLWARDEKEWTKAGVKISEKALEDIKVDFRTQYEINLKEAEDTDRNKLRETYSSVRAELRRLNWAEDAVARVTERDPDAVNNMQTVWPETTFNVEAGKYAPAAAQANQYVISRKWDIDSYRELTPFQRENLAFFYGTHRTRMTDAAIPFRERPPWLEKFQEQKIDYLKPLQDWKEIYVEKAVDEQYRQALNEQMPLVPPKPVFDTPQTFLTFAVGQTLAHNKLNPNNPVNIFQKSGEIMKQGLAQYGFRVIPQAGKAIADFGFSMGMMDKKTHSEFVGLSYDAASGIIAGSLAASAFGKLSVATPVGIATGITTFLSKQLGRARAAEERKRWRARRDVERELYYKRVERERERIRVGRAKRTREIEYRQKLRAWMREGAKMPELLKQPAWFMRRFVEPRRVVVERWMRRPTFQTKIGLIESAKRELRAPKIKW